MIDFKKDFISGLATGDILTIERYAHVCEYGELVEIFYDFILNNN